jgi:hypothetical protein
MSIRLSYVKMGTKPYGPALVKGKRTMPDIGDRIQIRPDNGDKSIHSNPWKWVIIDAQHESCTFVHGVSKYGA